MKLSALNEWLTLVANLGVLAGIIFLAVELQQNTQMMRAQTRNAMTENQMSLYESIYIDSEAFEIWDTGRRNSDFSSGLEGDNMRFFQFIQANLRLWENEWYQYQTGLFDREEFEPRMEIWATTITQPGYRYIWELIQPSFAPDFRTQLNSMLEAP